MVCSSIIPFFGRVSEKKAEKKEKKGAGKRGAPING
jgi:hypothetical protein